jgi:hypothetical protein
MEKTIQQSDLALKARNLRSSAGVTLTALAIEMRCNRLTLTDKELGRAKMRDEDFAAIQAALVRITSRRARRLSA